MTPLQSEQRRLYLPTDPATPPDSLADPQGRVRCLVLELTGPPDWKVLARVWQGVQDLGLPAPAIAVSGSDGLQLWFSLAEPLAAARGHAFLLGLRTRFLTEVKPGRIRLMPASGAIAGRPDLHARLVPAPQPGPGGDGGNWSAFVAPDLAPVFGDTPWLDIPPSPEGQAELLRRLVPMAPAAFDTAWQMLGLGRQKPAPPAEPGATPRMAAAEEQAPAHEEPRAFLLRVMNDAGVDLALRIEAAKALLQQP